MRMELAGHLRSRRQESSGKQFFSLAGSVRGGCGALGSFSARLGYLLVGGVSVVLVANPSENHTL